MKYQCPVCFYPNMEHPPKQWHICPCCGTEFEYDDNVTSHRRLRADWINAGCPWFSLYERPPDNWDPIAQLDSYYRTPPKRVRAAAMRLLALGTIYKWFPNHFDYQTMEEKDPIGFEEFNAVVINILEAAEMADEEEQENPKI